MVSVSILLDDAANDLLALLIVIVLFVVIYLRVRKKSFKELWLDVKEVFAGE